MKRRAAGIVLLIGMLLAVGMWSGGPNASGVRAQDGDATVISAGRCQGWEVTRSPDSTSTATVTGLYRSIKFDFMKASNFNVEGIPELQAHGTSIGVFCLEAGGLVEMQKPDESFAGFLTTIWLPLDTTGQLEVTFLDSSGAAVGPEALVCDKPDCSSPTDVPVAEGDKVTLKAGQGIRLNNADFTLANPSGSPVEFNIAQIYVADLPCPTICWLWP